MILPAPPFKVKGAFLRQQILLLVVLALFGFGIGGGSLWLAASAGQAALLDARVWKEGDTAVETQVEGKEKTNRFIFKGYELDVDYVDAQGRKHRGRTEFDTLFGSVDQESEPVVHYLRNDPSSFALSWGQDVLVYRWLSVGFFVLVGLGLFGLFLTVCVRMSAELRAVRACSRRAREVEMNVVEEQVEAARVVYTLEGSAPTGPVSASLVVNAELGDLFFLDKARSRVLGLVSPDFPHRAVVLRHDLTPFEFPEAVLRRIRQRVGN